MRNKLKQLQVFTRDWLYKAPDSSEIGLGPQKFNSDSDINGPGSIATAIFMPGAANAVMHKRLAEQWFYIDGPDFYIWLCPESCPIELGQYYKITPGTKFEIPPRTKFQVYNPSNELVPVLMITFPFWPQDDSSTDEITFPEGVFKPKEPCPFEAKKVEDGYIEQLYMEDPIAQVSRSGFEYVQIALASIGEDVHSYRIAGDFWFKFSGQLEYAPMSKPEGHHVCQALDERGILSMRADIDFSVRQSTERRAAKSTFLERQWNGRRGPLVTGGEEQKVAVNTVK